MKIYSSSITAPEFEFDFDDSERYHLNVVKYLHAVKNECIQHGHNGKHTGKILSLPVADGSACYMFSDGGRNSRLIHLEIYDSYMSPMAQYMPKSDILKFVKPLEKFIETF